MKPTTVTPNIVGVAGSNLLGGNTDISKWIEISDQLSSGSILLIRFLAASVIFAGTFTWSLSFMNNKEY